MGCSSSAPAVSGTGASKVKMLNWQKRPYKGVETEGARETREQMAAFADMPLEDLLLDSQEKVEQQREMMIQDGMAGLEAEKEFYEKWPPQVDQMDEKFTTRDGTVMDLYVYRPKTLKGVQPVFCYAHGGGAVFMDAKYDHSYLAYIAINLQCVVVGINYRKGPEVKCPVGQQDWIDGIKHVVQNTQKYQIDPNKMCLTGVSGGGWIMGGAVNLLIKQNDPIIKGVKCCMFETSMLTHEHNNTPEDKWQPYMSKYGPHPKWLTSVFQCHATDWANQQNDDQLFPGKVSDEVVKKYPPSVVFTSEFDFIRDDNTKWAARLKAHGKLAGLSEMPGTTHSYHGMKWSSPETKEFHDQQREAFNLLVAGR